MRRLLAAIVIGTLSVVLAVLPGLGGSAQAWAAGPTINGGGSSFAAVEFQQWAPDVARRPYDLTVNYVSSSSGAGRINYAQGLYDFGASDVIYNENEDGPSTVAAADNNHPFKYVTVTAGGLSFMYNLVNPNGTRVTNLKLTRNEVCQIFTGELQKWNDPELVGTDPFLASFNAPINVITRSDSAGESYVLSQYCLAVDRHDWSEFVNYTNAHASQESYNDDRNLSAYQPVSYWPSQLVDGVNEPQASGADPVATAVADPSSGKDAISYMATAYAKVRNFPVASVQNGANVFTQPTANAVNIALSYAHRNNLGTFNLDFSGPSPAAYFPSTYSYVLAPDHTESNFDLAKGKVLSEFLCFDVGLGQAQATGIGYAPLARAVVNLSVNAIEHVPGAPPPSQCGKGGPAPNIPQQPGTGGTAPPTATTTTTAPSSAAATTTTTAPGSSSTTTPGAGRGSTSSTTVAPGSGGSGGTAGASAVTHRGRHARRAAVTPAASSSTTAPASGAFGGEPGQPAGGTTAAAPTTALTAAGGSTGPGVTDLDTLEWLLIGALLCAVGLTAREVGRRVTG